MRNFKNCFVNVPITTKRLFEEQAQLGSPNDGSASMHGVIDITHGPASKHGNTSDFADTSSKVRDRSWSSFFWGSRSRGLSHEDSVNTPGQATASPAVEMQLQSTALDDAATSTAALDESHASDQFSNVSLNDSLNSSVESGSQSAQPVTASTDVPPTVQNSSSIDITYLIPSEDRRHRRHTVDILHPAQQMLTTKLRTNFDLTVLYYCASLVNGVPGTLYLTPTCLCYSSGIAILKQTKEIFLLRDLQDIYLAGVPSPHGLTTHAGCNTDSAAEKNKSQSNFLSSNTMKVSLFEHRRELHVAPLLMDAVRVKQVVMDIKAQFVSKF